MGKTYRRPPIGFASGTESIKQHKDLLENDRYSSRVEKNKKKEKKNKHPKRIIQEEISGFE